MTLEIHEGRGVITDKDQVYLHLNHLPPETRAQDQVHGPEDPRPDFKFRP